MREFLQTLARLYAYPDERYRIVIAQATDMAAEYDDSVYSPMRGLFDWVSTTHQTQLEEEFTSTFDLSPSCNPEVGWHIWGEDYNRGAFMADLRDEFERYGIEEQGELPDHLIHMLPLVAAMEPEEAEQMARRQILPALAAMHEQLKRSNSEFASLIEATYAAVKQSTGIEEDIGPPPRREKSVDMVFSKSLSTPSAQGGFE